MNTLLIIALSVIGAVLLFFGIKSKSFQKILCGITSILGSLVIGLLKKNKEQKEKIKKQENAIKAQTEVIHIYNDVSQEISNEKEQQKIDVQPIVEEIKNEKTENGQIAIGNNIINSFNCKHKL